VITETASRLDTRTVRGLAASVGLSLLIGGLCAGFDAPAWLQGTLTGSAAGLPAAIEYTLTVRRRDPIDEIARLRRGVFSRPIFPVVVMMTMALVIVETIGGWLFIIITDDANLGDGHLQTVIKFIAAVLLIPGALAFLIAARASHYFGKHPYLWTSIAVGLSFFYVIVIYWYYYGVGQVLMYSLPCTVVYLAACLLGAWYGSSRQDRFLTKKLVRMQRNAARWTVVPKKQSAEGQHPNLQRLPPPNPRDRRLE
jgi:hypothetical protein